MRKYEILSLDVWAGEDEGLWDINNCFRCGNLEIDDGKDIINAMIDEGYLSTYARDIASYIDYDDIIQIIDTSNFNKPVYNLRELIEC